MPRWKPGHSVSAGGAGSGSYLTMAATAGAIFDLDGNPLTEDRRFSLDDLLDGNLQDHITTWDTSAELSLKDFVADAGVDFLWR